MDSADSGTRERIGRTAAESMKKCSIPGSGKSAPRFPHFLFHRPLSLFRMEAGRPGPEICPFQGCLAVDGSAASVPGRKGLGPGTPLKKSAQDRKNTAEWEKPFRGVLLS